MKNRRVRYSSMRVFALVTVTVAATAFGGAHIAVPHVIDPTDAATLTGGQCFSNSRCLPAGDCEGLNLPLTVECTSPGGDCSACTNGATPINGCAGGETGFHCTYSDTADIDCGDHKEGTCTGSLQCTNLGGVLGDCNDFFSCATESGAACPP
jgi:hypothetical protein